VEIWLEPQTPVQLGSEPGGVVHVSLGQPGGKRSGIPCRRVAFMLASGEHFGRKALSRRVKFPIQVCGTRTHKRYPGLLFNHRVCHTYSENRLTENGTFRAMTAHDRMGMFQVRSSTVKRKGCFKAQLSKPKRIEKKTQKKIFFFPFPFLRQTP